MAKYSVEHSCGHSATYQIYGKQEARYRKIEWYESRECDKCMAEKSGMEGTTKQKAWAQEIRESFIASHPAKKDAAMRIKSAKAWIENRYGALDLVRRYAIAEKMEAKNAGKED